MRVRLQIENLIIRERKKIIDQLYDQKSLTVYKDNFKLVDKDISYDDFVKLASEK